MPRFPLPFALIWGVCALAAAGVGVPRPPHPLLSQGRRPPLFALPDRGGHLVSLQPLLGRKRIVILAIPAGPLLQGTAFLRDALARRADFDARDLVVLALVPPKTALAKTFDLSPIRLLSDSDGQVARAYGGSLGTPAFYLIGKDGGIKMARRTFPSMRELLGTVDAMPMRREEARRHAR